MSSDLSSQQLADARAQLTVNVVGTVAASELANDSTKLFKLQELMSDSKERVLETKQVLDDLEDYEINTAVAQVMDNTLERAGVVIAPTKDVTVVMGAEELGRGLSPRDFRLSRVAAMENFLLDFFRKTKEITRHLGMLFSESYTLFTTNLESLELTLQNLELSLETLDEFKSVNKVNLGTTLYNTFKQEGSVKGDWVRELTRLRGTVRALANTYMIGNVNYLQKVYSYFGGFDKVNMPQAETKLSMLAKSVRGIPFKECTYNIGSKDGYLVNPDRDLVVKRSVKLLGDKYFVDARSKVTATTPIKTVNDASDFLRTVLLKEGTKFFSENKILDVNDTPVDSLSSKEIKQVIVIVRDILNEWSKLFKELDSKKINNDEYRDIRRSIFDNKDITEDIRLFAIEGLDLLTVHSQVELVDIGASVNRYLTLLVNGVVELIHLSIEANSEVE